MHTYHIAITVYLLGKALYYANSLKDDKAWGEFIASRIILAFCVLFTIGQLG